MKDETKIRKLIEDLKILWKLERGKIDDFKSKVKLKESKEYLEGLPYAKPESILSDKLMRPLLDALELKSFSEIHPPGGESGWVDYIITGVRNPVALELKPLHGHNGEKKPLKDVYNSMRGDKREKNQIIKYLRGTGVSGGGVDYVILTNMEDVYYFSRDAIKNFEPFYKEKFDDFVNGLMEIEDIWEYVRRKEDSTPKRDLDEYFLKDLRRWVDELSQLQWTVENPYEFIIHLLNKFVFIRTLEDFGLVPFRILQENFQKYEKEWGPKGVKIMLQRFFDEVDTWFYYYYDTELFREKSMDYLVDTENNLEKFKETIKKVLGFTFLGDVFFQGMMSYNFRHIDEDVFGKSYETYLAERRKEEGIYYTPKEITNYMARRLVKEIFNPIKDELIDLLQSGEYVKKFEHTKELVKKLITITILDPACGSGSFLIKVLREIYKVYRELDEATKWVTDVWRRSSFTLSKDIEERVNKITEIRELLGLNKGENSRLLITLIILRHIYGVDLDERAIEVAKANIWKEAVKLDPHSFRYSKLPKDINHILPDLEMNFVVGNSVTSPPEEEIVRIVADEFREEIKQLWKIRDEYLKNPFDPRVLDKMKPIKDAIREKLYEKMQEGGWDFEKISFFPLEFFFLYYDHDGNPKPEESRGFHGIIGNPPYIRVDNLPEKEKKFWRETFISSSGKYDIYYLFIEKAYRLLRENGVCIYITPNKYCASISGTNLRKFMKSNSRQINIVSVSNINVFKEAANYPVITLFRKGKSFEYVRVSAVNSIDELENENMPLTYTLNGDMWRILPLLVIPINVSEREVYLVIRLLQENPTKLSDYLKISEGLRIPNKYEKDEKSDYEIVKQYQFERWIPIKEGSYITKSDLRKVISMKSNRYIDMQKDKILIAEDALRITATIDKKGRVPQGGVYFGIPQNDEVSLEYILAVLNSNLMSFVYNVLFSGMHMGGGYERYRSKFLQELPFQYSPEKHSVLTQLVKDILNNYKLLTNAKNDSEKEKITKQIQLLEENLNRYIYGIYGLNADEIKIVESRKN